MLMTLTAGCETNCGFHRHGCFSPFVIIHPVCCLDISRTNAACNDAHLEDEGGFRSESALLLTPESLMPPVGGVGSCAESLVSNKADFTAINFAQVDEDLVHKQKT